MKDFEFHAPSSLDQAAGALEGNDGAKLLAGGMSLLPVMKLELAEPTHLVSLAGLSGLSDIREVHGGIEVGAMCTHAAVAASAVVRDRIPALAELALHIGDPQVRNRGTIGGSVAHNDPAADYPALAQNPDLIFPTLMFDLLPVGIRGLIITALVAAIMSSVDSTARSSRRSGSPRRRGRRTRSSRTRPRSTPWSASWSPIRLPACASR